LIGAALGGHRGLFLPFWFIWSLRPNKFDRTVFVGEHGHEQWGVAPITPAQRVLSVAIALTVIIPLIGLLL